MDRTKAYSDAELIELSKKNPESFGILMERYQWPLFHYIRRTGQIKNEDVQDILQEVFIKIYTKLNEYEETLRFSSWAYRIAHNHLMDHFRKIKARPRTDALEQEEWEKLITVGVSAEKKAADRDCLEKIKACINNLPIEYKEIMILRFIEEKSYDEIMDILKKPKGSVATLLSRGKIILRNMLRKRNIDCF